MTRTFRSFLMPRCTYCFEALANSGTANVLKSCEYCAERTYPLAIFVSLEQGVKHTIKENKTYFLTLTVQGWVDVFIRQCYRDIIIEALDYCMNNKGLNVYAYVIMSNHMHMIVNCNEPFELKDTIRDFKKYTSKACLHEVQEGVESRKEWMLGLFSQFAKDTTRNKTFKFWKVGSHAIELHSPKFTWIKVNYIHQNPVRAGLVRKPEHWMYSSMSNYLEMDSVLQGVIPVTPYLNHKG